MPRAKQSTKTTVRKTSTANKKGAGRKPGVKEYTAKDKSAAMVVVDFMGGNLLRAAQATGINRGTLHKWRDELREGAGEEEAQEVHTEGTGRVIHTLERLVDQFAVKLLMKAQEASMRDLFCTLGVACDKINLLTTNRGIKAAVGEIAPKTEAPIIEPPPLELPPSIEAETLKEHWESTVNRVMAEATADGQAITREQAVQAIIDAHPNAKEHLVEEYSH